MKEFAQLQIGFLGFGKMGSAIAAGVARHYPELKRFAYDPSKKPSVDDSGIAFLESAVELERTVDLLLLCVKPQEMKRALETLSGEKLYISIAAGLTIDRIKGYFNSGSVKIARTMPNMGALIGKSVTGLFCEDEELARLGETLFEGIGTVVRLDSEKKMHAVTGLSGSGPAYAFEFIHALAEGGVQTGLPYPTALQMAAHTLLAAAETVIQTGEHPSVLRNNVTSPGGTTIAGLKELELASFHGAVIRAVEEATRRSEELERE